MFITPLQSGKWSRVGAILLHFYFYSILKEKMEFYIGDALKQSSQVQWLKLFCYKKKKDKDYFISLTHFSVYRTNIYVNPPVAPPLIGGYGYGCGGWGLSPFSFFAPGPAVAVGVGGGFDPSFSSCFLEPLQP